MEIRTQRLLLKPLTMEYLNSAFEYASDPENTRLMMYLPLENMAEEEQFIREAEAEWRRESPHRLEFAMLKDAEHIGGMTLYFLDKPGEAELGWVVRKDHWGQGYAVEAARGLMGWAREKYAIRRMIACCDCENFASQRVMEKLGMICCDKDGRRTNRSMGDEPRVEWTYEMYI